MPLFDGGKLPVSEEHALFLFGFHFSSRGGKGLVPAVSLMLFLAGCLPVAVVGSGASIGYVATEDRSMKDNLDDAVLCATISKAWTDFNSQLNDDLNCHAYQARVLLTGRVPSQSWSEEAFNRANQVPGIKEVYNEITVGPGGSFTNNVHDGYITQHLNAELLTASDVHSNNYIITTAGGVVFIIGTARDQAELDRVINYGRNMNGVKRVVSYIRILGAAGGDAGSANAGAPAPQSSPGPGDTSPNAPTPRGEIVVTPLK
jgi:osmotically-inducible protein OsmY